MARKALIEKANKKPKFSTRKKNRCKTCGRSRGFLGEFLLCRLCFRKFALDGLLPGVKKTSW
jgi:small subunit ribosomal protein S14